MIIKEVIPVKSLPLSMDTISILYPSPDEHQEDRQVLSSVIKVFSAEPKAFTEDYTFYIVQTALDKFLQHVNHVYEECGHEATGLFVGYYLHHPKDEGKKIAVATDFLPSFGNSSVVTCEISYEDAARNAAYCISHKVVSLAQGHTHPFRGHVLRFSSVDSNTLRTNFAAPHQMSFVCNNLSKEFVGYKIIDNEERNESLYSIDLEKSLATDDFVSKCLYQAVLKTEKDGKNTGIGQEAEPSLIQQESEPTEQTAINNPSLLQFKNVKALLCGILLLQVIELALILFPYIKFNSLIKMLIIGSLVELL
ncbi:MAG: hypothetical protein IJK46_07730 [Prevotella sp.]|nr:hypothetical protein [Prevotella sp.]